MLDDAGAPVVAVGLLDVSQFFSDDAHYHAFRGKHRPQVLDILEQFLPLFDDLVPFQPCETLEPHLQDGIGLDLVETEVRHEALLRFSAILRCPDEGDDFVEIVQSDNKAGKDVRPFFGLSEFVPGASHHNVFSVHEVVPKQRLQCQDLGPSVYQGQQDASKTCLKTRMLEQLVQNHLGLNVSPDLYDDPEPLVLVALVAKVGHSLDFLVPHQIRNGLDKSRLVHLVRNLVDNDGLFAVLLFLNPRAGPESKDAPAGRVEGLNGVVADDKGSCREVGPLDMLHQLLDRRIGPVDQHV